MAQDNYDAGDIVVYPTHGVGEVKGIETQDLGELSVEVIVIQFDSERMTLRVPTNKANQSGLRPLSSKKIMDSAITTLRGRAKVLSSYSDASSSSRLTDDELTGVGGTLVARSRAS